MYTVAVSLVLCLLPLSRAAPSGSRPSTCNSPCSLVKSLLPDSPTGYYTIADDDGLPHQVYCNMGAMCGSDGGWTRVAYLNMSDTTQQCPDTLKLYEQDGVRACGRATINGSSCQSVQFTTLGNYTEVCGRVIGYQYGYSSGVNPYGHHDTDEIDETYVAGVSITQGSPRQHIWTFIAAFNNSCPCKYFGSGNPLLPSFTGDDWSCESATGSSATTNSQLHTDDPLWDGRQCGPLEPCCSTAGHPWFRRALDSPSSDDLELRVCEDTGGERDSPVALYEIYVK